MDVARPGNNGPGGAVACGLSALAAAAFPLLVLGAGWLALALPDGLDAPWADAWTKDHRDAWALFWTAMLAFNVGEVL
ncbi:MAG: hypothetical protein GX548_07595, partial [Lentisphaerae bacterium]|nr:hypothetical protein [Lentisphaerota bacterium]